MSSDSRVAIVTGAGGMLGIGRAIALRLSREGYRIGLVDIQVPDDMRPPHEREAGWRGIESVREEIAAQGGEAILLWANISDEAQVEDACLRTVAQFGRIDVLVNNARAMPGRDRVPVAEMDVAEWDRVMAVNTRGTFLFSRAVLKHLHERGSTGQIINISSLSGKRGMANHAAYSASKFAIIGLTQSMAEEVGPMGIRVNAICPGVVDTRRFSLSEKLAAEAAGLTLEEFTRQKREERLKQIPLRKAAVAEDVAGVAAFLVSEDSSHMTGQSINVDGGEVFH